MEVETITAREAAHILHTSPPIITEAILNGTLPIGFVGKGSKTRTVIIKKRLEQWVEGKLDNLVHQ